MTLLTSYHKTNWVFLSFQIEMNFKNIEKEKLYYLPLKPKNKL
jgi:hypothetical protein